ncbi:MFS transporter [Halomonas sp. MCCC 1A17488]|uniref:MFS transporter n=1 Tax=unclassified Halomonas TaxID=2609666 RepID=UPI0018D24C79|nr:MULTISPECIES: MFS transporter [unclassified Halomonas]MCE8016120.1 MFS transporter [Halomonas sp. MCCC 1A17488]MCG3239453.1 MFS transporter [Halomonas sp. MCCC 1A17488]QPP50621.1 MFS transporter [Halomonas sp. SS10-MC5]
MPKAALPLINARLRVYLAGNAASAVGTWAQRIILLWLAWDTTQSSFMLGLMAMADLLPSVIVAPFAGTLIDRKHRIRLALRLQLLSILPPCMMLLATVAGLVSPAFLLVVAGLTGILNGFDHPTRMVVVSSIIPKEDVPGAVAINSMVFNLARMLGPAAAGLALTLGILWSVFIFNAISYLLFALILSRLACQEAPEKGTDTNAPANSAIGKRQGSYWSAVRNGLTSQHKLLLLFFALLALCYRPIFELLPAFAAHLAVGEAERATAFSLMTSAQGFGATLGALVTSVLLARGRPLVLTMGFGLSAVVGCALFLISNALWAALASLMLLSGAILANGVCTQVILQTQVPDIVRGKVLSLYTMIFRGLPALGAMAVGLIAGKAHERAIFAIGSLPVLVMLLKIIWTLNRGRKKQAPSIF